MMNKIWKTWKIWKTVQTTDNTVSQSSKRLLRHIYNRLLKLHRSEDPVNHQCDHNGEADMKFITGKRPTPRC